MDCSISVLGMEVSHYPHRYETFCLPERIDPALAIMYLLLLNSVAINVTEEICGMYERVFEQSRGTNPVCKFKENTLEEIFRVRLN